MTSTATKSQQPRYRIEDGEPCIDVSAATAEQLYDNRDPAPFRGRELDPDLVEYLRDAAEDLCRHPAYRVVFWIGVPCPQAEIADAFRAQFEYHLERLRRRRREQGRTIRVALLLALAFGSVLLTLSQLVAASVTGWLGVSAREALVIVSWVVLWRPVEGLLYDWIPLRRERRVVTKLLAARLDVRPGEGPEPTQGTLRAVGPRVPRGTAPRTPPDTKDTT